MTTDKANDNDVIIGLAVFCIKCMESVKIATYADMNGQTIKCSTCGTHSNSAIGISVVSNSQERLHHAYEEMNKHKKTVNELLSERIPTEDV